MAVDANGVEIPTAVDDEAIRQARMDADAARAEALRVKKELDEAKKLIPSDDARARYAQLEEQAQRAEEERLKKEGDFTAWRTQIAEKHDKALAELREQKENASAQAQAIEKDLQATLIGQEFAKASDLFGPTGKTILPPDVAQDHFARHVVVETAASPNGGAPARRVVVKDYHGAVIVDPKSGQPMPFGKAMAELIESHPQKNQLLRGSNKSGSNSPGGAHGGQDTDLSRLKAEDFQDPKVRAAVKARQNAAGGLQFGTAFDRLKKT